MTIGVILMCGVILGMILPLMIGEAVLSRNASLCPVCNGKIQQTRGLKDNEPSPKYILEHYKDHFDPCPPNPTFDGLSIPWKEFNYVNPPYSNKIPWIKKAIEEQNKGNITVMLLPAATDAAWFHDLIVANKDVKIEFIRGRLKLDNGKHPKYPSILVTFYSKVNVFV